MSNIQVLFFLICNLTVLISTVIYQVLQVWLGNGSDG